MKPPVQKCKTENGLKYAEKMQGRYNFFAEPLAFFLEAMYTGM